MQEPTKHSTFELVSTHFIIVNKPIHLYNFSLSKVFFLADSCNDLKSTGYSSKLPERRDLTGISILAAETPASIEKYIQVNQDTIWHCQQLID